MSNEADDAKEEETTLWNRAAEATQRIERLAELGHLRLVSAIRYIAELPSTARDSDSETVAGFALHAIERLLDALEATGKAPRKIPSDVFTRRAMALCADLLELRVETDEEFGEQWDRHAIDRCRAEARALLLGDEQPSK